LKHVTSLQLQTNDMATPESYANTPELMARAVGAVSALAAQNESVRSKMNETGLLAVQEQLLMRCLSPFMLSSWEWDTRIHPILSMEAVFERVAMSKGFVTGHGVLFLVQLFIDMTTIQPLGDSNDVDRHLQQVQTRTSQILSNVFNASTTCLRELGRVIEDKTIIDMLLGVFNCSRTALESQTQSSSSSWWSSGSSNAEYTSSEIRRQQPGNRLEDWVTWINASENKEKKDQLRSRIGALLAPVYKTTESTLKRAIKAAGKMIQKHADRYEKNRRKQQEDQREQEERWNRNRANSTKRLSDRLRDVQHARDASMAKGRRGHEDLCHLDAFYDKKLFRSQWENLGAVDPWDLICEFQAVDQVDVEDEQ